MEPKYPKYKNLPPSLLECDHPLGCKHPGGKKVLTHCLAVGCIYLSIRSEAELIHPDSIKLDMTHSK